MRRVAPARAGKYPRVRRSLRARSDGCVRAAGSRRELSNIEQSRQGLTPVPACVLVLFLPKPRAGEGVMKGLVCAAVLSLMSISATFAQAPSAPPKMSADEKKAISKTCSDQANQKGLRGKDRRKFRAACIKNGGKSQ